MGCITATYEILILDDDNEDMVIGAWNKMIVRGVFGEATRIVNMVTFSISEPNPL
jgi:hypothetical protein